MRRILNGKRLLALVMVLTSVMMILSAGVVVAQTPTPTPTPAPGPTVTPTPTPTPGATPAAAGVPPEVTQYAKDWPMMNRDYSNTRATKDSTITSSNVKTLGIAWQFQIPGIGRYGAAASNPIVLGNNVYFQDLKANVYVINLQTGNVTWKKEYNSANAEGPNGPAVGYGKIFVFKDAYTLAALDINNGNELWATKLSNVATTGADIQPSVYDNLVYVSTVPGTGDVFYTPGGRGILYALDQQTGQIRWQFDTVKSPDLFGHPDVNSGGGAWYPPAIDTQSGQMFWDIANPAPFPGTAKYPNGSSYVGSTLYCDSILSMDHASGTLKWYNQVTPTDLYDHDLQISPILTTATVNGKQQNIVISAGKMGKVYAFNRDTGILLWETNVGTHNPESDLTRLPTSSSNATDNTTTTILPGAIGGVETPIAYADGYVYVQANDLPMDFTPSSIILSGLDFRRGTGSITAINVNSGQPLWIQKFPYMTLGGCTVVNDLVFTATYDGVIYALKRDTGDILWQFRAPAGINSWPAIVGDMLLFPAGAANTPAVNMVGTPTLLAFKLGLAGPSATPTPTPTPTATPTPTPTSTATPRPTVTPTPTPTATPSGQAVTISLTVQNIAFDKSTISVPAGAQVTVNFMNMDSGIPHNFAVYTNSSASTPIFVGQIITGPSSISYKFTAPSQPGNYFFRCDVHPTLMTGTFTVTVP